METKFNFKSQICTSIEQSERLLSLGLKKETADMALILNESDKTYFARPRDYVCAEASTSIPAWSLGRLIEMLALCSYEIYPKDNVFEDIIYDIEEAIKEGYFNKEYLEE